MKYVQEWMPQETSLLPFYAGIDQFLNEFLYTKTDSVKESGSKIIADPFLGYIHFEPIEMAIESVNTFQ